MSPIRRLARRTFRSLEVRNFRFYFGAQVVSVSGTWMQSVAQIWLVLHLTGSAVALGAVTALQFLPLLLFGAWGGVIADRLNKRVLLFGTQSAAGLLAVALGALVATGVVKLWMVYLMAVLLGLVTAVDNPTRQSFVHEMVGSANVANAVSLNSVLMNSARVVGPALAAVLISTVGLVSCFFANAASYAAVIVALALMRSDELQPAFPVPRAKGQLRQGFRYVWSNDGLRIPLLMMVLIGTLAYNFQVTLALMARFTFHGGAGAFGAMLALMSGGAVIGGLVVAGRKRRPTTATLVLAASAFGVLMLAVAGAPGLPVALVLLPAMGAASISFMATANATLQLRAAPEIRGRVMALYSIAFLGTTPVGAPAVGWVAQVASPRMAVGIGGIACLVAAIFAVIAIRRRGEGSVSPLPASATADGAELSGYGPAAAL